MRTQLSLILMALLTAGAVQAQEKKIDTVAIMLLNHMSNVIGDLESCKIKMSTSHDVNHHNYGMVTRVNHHMVYMDGPDKMHITTRGEKGHQGTWYDGELFNYYSYTENNYITIDAPDNILDVIDTINSTFGIEFPAADFFYPTFVDDLVDQFDQILFLGNKLVNYRPSYHILASNDELQVQIWLADDATFLPLKYSIIYKTEKYAPQYVADFEEWELNHVIPESLFNFMPPPNARMISIMSK